MKRAVVQNTQRVRKRTALTPSQSKKSIATLRDICTTMGSKYKLVKAIDVTYPLIMAWFAGRTPIGATHTRKILKVYFDFCKENHLKSKPYTDADLRPDIFYDINKER